MATIHGECDAIHDDVRDLMSNSIEAGADVGLSVCVIHQGRTTVDLWGGLADVERGSAWQRDTIINTFSLTKTMTAFAALLLIERGELDPDAPVAKYWPEFAANGKQDVLVRHLMSHTSGVSGWQEPITLEDLYDDEAAADLLAAQAPWWEPGTASGYHMINQGHLVGNVIRRITGRSLGTFFRTEVAEPLGADYYIGTPATEDARIATLVPPTELGIDLSNIAPDSVLIRTLTNPIFAVREVGTRAFRAAENGAAGGHGNARSVATVQAAVSHADPRFLSAATLARIFEVHSDGVDLVLGLPLRFGLGYGLVNETTPDLPSGRVCWWTGYGGSLVVNDLDRQLTFAYVMNRMEPALIGLGRAVGYLEAVYRALGA
jgi:CubicO group peptidase (beta-lactamase class C family)